MLIAAGPGVGKSLFMLVLALMSRVPTYYFSADSGPEIQLERAISILTGWHIEETREKIEGKTVGEANDQLAGIPIRFDTSASPDPDLLENELKAYFEVYGDFPELIIVDNITNVTGLADNADDPFSGLESLMDYLSELARDTEACVVGLHHVNGAYNDGNTPIPLSGIKGQIGRVPAMVLTLHKETLSDDVLMNVSTVKNRSGNVDSTGLSSVPLRFVGERMQITDWDEGND